MKKKEKYELEKVCAYCEHATTLAGGEHVLCDRKGVVSDGYKCRKFVYDPIKRVPKRGRMILEPETDPDIGREASATKLPVEVTESEEAAALAAAYGNDPDEKAIPDIELPRIDDIV